MMCKADPPNENKPIGGVNYNQPCVPVIGSYDGQPRSSCKYCGKWMDEVDRIEQAIFNAWNGLK